MAPMVPVPANPVVGNPLDVFGSPASQQVVPAFGAPTAMLGVQNGATPTVLIVPGFTHNYLTIEFECNKPDTWNKGVSELIARCKNSGPDAMYGFNLQCAVPKYVSMEMEPPSSTSIPVTGGNAMPVTQKIKVTNSMIGTKNLMLKLKVSFTLQGVKTEHLATCSGFPAGEY